MVKPECFGAKFDEELWKNVVGQEGYKYKPNAGSWGKHSPTHSHCSWCSPVF